MTPTLRGQRAAFLLLALLLALLLPIPATAISPTSGGGRIRVADAPIGNYIVTAVTTPDPLTPGQAQVTVAVGRAGTEERITDAEVAVLVRRPTSEAPPQRYSADHATAGNAFDYGAHIELPTTGLWEFTVVVTGPEGSGEASFAVDVQQALNIGVVIACAVPFILGIIFGGWLLLTRTQGDDGELA